MNDLTIIILIWATLLGLAFYPIMWIIDYFSHPPRKRYPPERP